MKTEAILEADKMVMSNWVHDLADWSAIAHHTFVWEASLDSTRRCYEKFMKREIPEVSFFYAIEQNPGRPGHHVHALWANCDEVVRRGVWQSWFDRYGRSRIEPCRSREDVAGYCSKYVTKAGAWWNFRLDHQAWLALKK